MKFVKIDAARFMPNFLYITGKILCKLDKNITSLLKTLARTMPKIVYITVPSKPSSMS